MLVVKMKSSIVADSVYPTPQLVHSEPLLLEPTISKHRLLAEISDIPISFKVTRMLKARSLEILLPQR